MKLQRQPETTTRIVKFLRESNAIEDVWDADSLQQAIYAWEYCISEPFLTPAVIRKTHKILMLHQPLQPDEKGYFRSVGVYIGNRVGKPPYVVPELINQWCVNARDIIVNGKNEFPRFLKSIIQEHHVQYEIIHPFIDGNGRTGRIFMNWERIKLGFPVLIIKESEKQEYYLWFS